MYTRYMSISHVRRVRRSPFSPSLAFGVSPRDPHDPLARIAADADKRGVRRADGLVGSFTALDGPTRRRYHRYRGHFIFHEPWRGRIDFARSGTDCTVLCRLMPHTEIALRISNVFQTRARVSNPSDIRLSANRGGASSPPPRDPAVLCLQRIRRDC